MGWKDLIIVIGVVWTAAIPGGFAVAEARRAGKPTTVFEAVREALRATPCYLKWFLAWNVSIGLLGSVALVFLGGE